MGTKAWEKAPSAEMRLNRLGILKATKKASVSIPAPKILAIKLSLTKPKILDTKVMLPTVASALRRFIEFIYLSVTKLQRF